MCGVNFIVFVGECVVLIGVLGVGKFILMWIIYGNYFVVGGFVVVGGVDVI